MQPGQLDREGLKETAADVQRAHRLGEAAERLRTSRRRRGIRGLVVSGVVAAVVATGVAVALVLDDDDGQVRPSGVTDSPRVDVTAHPDQSPPRELISAGRVAVSAYYTTKSVKQPNGDAVGTYRWSLLDAATGRYEKTGWAWLDVAPGMRTAAVLERGLPVDRIGLLDLTSGRIQRWIRADRGVGSVQFSPDGKQLLATAYGLDPDGLFKDASYRLNDKTVPGPKQSRTGYYVIDVASGRTDFTERPYRKNAQRPLTAGGRQDFLWSRDGSLVWEPWSNKAGGIYYDVHGKEVPHPPKKASLPYQGAVVSPDGNLVTGAFAGDGDQIVSEVLDVRTGKRAALVPGQQLVAWADNDHVIAWRCDPDECSPGKGEFRNQLLLVSLDGKQTTPLSGFRKATLRYDGRWTPVFTRR
ncbi:hypothetical protein [Streptomyces sp. LN549]|uniref:hypothetical protein n=1 Tax=Streptomyces sp. LN549 TaxID=3112979 RepID=UPI003712EA6F